MSITVTPDMAEWSTADILRYLEIQGEGIVPPEVFEELLGNGLRGYAFTVSKLADIEMIRDVWAALLAVEQSGGTMQDFADAVQDILAVAGWTSLDPWHIQNIFRTNMATIMSAARMEYMMDVADELQWWILNVTLDDRTTDNICRPLAQPVIVLPAGHPWWATHTPPLHFGCRTEITATTTNILKAMGLSPTNAADIPEVDVDYEHGFGYGYVYGDATQIQNQINKTMEEFGYA